MSVVYEGQWGPYYLALRNDGMLSFAIPREAGKVLIISVNLTPNDGGALGVTPYSLELRAGPQFSGGRASPTPVQSGTQPPPGAPPANALPFEDDKP